MRCRPDTIEDVDERPEVVIDHDLVGTGCRSGPADAPERRAHDQNGLWCDTPEGPEDPQPFQATRGGVDDDDVGLVTGGQAANQLGEVERVVESGRNVEARAM